MRRNTRKSLTTAQKREVKRIVQSVEPKQWEPLFVVEACASVDVAPAGTCQGAGVLELVASPGTAPAWGEVVVHRTRGALWFVPTIDANVDTCEALFNQTGTVYFRWALWRQQNLNAGSMPVPSLFNDEDWGQAKGMIRRGEHTFGGPTYFQSSVTSGRIPFASYKGIVSLASGTTLAIPVCVDVDEGNVNLQPCEDSSPFMTTTCTSVSQPVRAYRWEASKHIPKNLRVSDGDQVLLVYEWCGLESGPTQVMSTYGGIHGETSESTGA